MTAASHPEVLMSRRFLPALTACVALAAGSLALNATPAAAVSIYFGLLPKSEPSLDVAAVHGLDPNFGLNKRNSDGLDEFEQWAEVPIDPAVPTVLRLITRARGPEGLLYCMDARPPAKTSPTLFDIVGTRSCNGNSSQRWVRVDLSTGVAYRNVQSGYYLTARSGVIFPGYDQRVFDGDRSTFTKKTP
jgi:hypothetical protein